ncbi:MAG: sugar transferase [Bacteriovoracaceae bacterium]|nr:sugar transferase [Bacteriovoracaceae bacterium]
MKRFFDFTFALIVTFFSLPLMVLVMIVVRMTSRGPALYWSDRVGIENEVFSMPKFRTMLIETPQVATHLLNDSQSYLTAIGGFLRKTSLDELPQLWTILKGDMSFVGPRPALYNQADLIAMRTRRGVHKLRPGLTGWAQINGRDELDLEEKVQLDFYYLTHRSFFMDFKIIILTLVRVAMRKGISH